MPELFHQAGSTSSRLQVHSTNMQCAGCDSIKPLHAGLAMQQIILRYVADVHSALHGRMPFRYLMKRAPTRRPELAIRFL